MAGRAQTGVPWGPPEGPAAEYSAAAAGIDSQKDGPPAAAGAEADVGAETAVAAGSGTGSSPEWKIAAGLW